MSSRRIGVIGAGSWGTALADCLSRNGHAVRLWSHEIEVADAIREQHRNEAYLPGVELDPRLEASPDLAEVLDRAEVVVSVSPSEFVRATMERARSCLPTDPFLLVSASKGLELETDLRMSEVLLQVLGGEVAEGCVVLSGPSFAAELARQRPTAVTLASRSEEMAIATQELFQNEHFRLYTQSDVIGTELGGALKNVIALAAGISDGLGLGHNARAALLTRSLAEIRRLTHKLGGEPETLAG
ncbi:MAG: NAD(P)-dependent glycerol-3-phosphate dehydrogenase, partial [marine benthic group bacterium]|nr:NAD(P)-dependent glycerol-3-phosphate dehydrogenase [Gemmatimonadota bacterium]